jgi:hypothetical protein
MANVPVGETIAAVAALGTAAFGLVDAAKAFWGGPSLSGFGYIRSALTPFAPALETVGSAMFFDTLKANWINGVALDDQKAKAKALIHLGINGQNAERLAAAAGVDTGGLETVAKKIDQGVDLDQQDIILIGRFDAIVSAKLDQAFERADQTYRTSTKLLAGLVAIGLALFGNISLGYPIPWYEATLVGLVSTPLAPMAKDLASSLATAANAIGSLKK